MPSSVWHEILALDAQYNTCRFPNKREPFFRTLYLRRRSQLLREYGLEYSASTSNNNKSDIEATSDNDTLSNKSEESGQATPNNHDQARSDYLHLRRQLLTSRYGPIHQSTSTTESPFFRRSRSRNGSTLSLFHPTHLMMDSSQDLTENGDGVTNIVVPPRSLSFSGFPTFLSSQSESSSSKSVASSSSRIQSSGVVVPTRRAEASRALAGNTSVSENYAFSGIKHIFDHHSPAAVSRIHFPHNDPTRLAMASADGTLSVCRTWPSQTECVLTVMKGHSGPITDLDWTTANDFIVTVSRDRTACLWNVEQASCTRSFAAREIDAGELLACQLQPMNNNLLAVGGLGGALQMLNMSTGKAVKVGRDKLPGSVTSVAFEMAMGTCLWVGTSQGLIQSYKCEPATGRLTRARRLNVSSSGSAPVTSLAFRSWMSREARDPCLLCNLGATTTNSPFYKSPPASAKTGLLLLRVVSPDGQLVLKQRFPLLPSRVIVRSCFFPLISFRQGACVVSGSDDTRIHMFDVGGESAPGVGTGCSSLPALQGHASCVIDVAVSCDERVMASADATGNVIVWKRGNEPEEDRQEMNS